MQKKYECLIPKLAVPGGVSPGRGLLIPLGYLHAGERRATGFKSLIPKPPHSYKNSFVIFKNSVINPRVPSLS